MCNWNRLKDMNFSNVDINSCCDYIMINSGRQFYCDKYDLLIEHGGAEEMAVGIMCAQHNTNTDICWAKTKCAFALYQDRNDSAAIIKHNDEFVEAHPEDPEGYKIRGMFNSTLFGGMNSCRTSFSPSWQKVIEEHFDEAINEYAEKTLSDFSTAIKLGSKDADIFAFRGSVYSSLKKYTDALADFNEAIRLNPECVNAYGYRALMYLGESTRNRENADLDKAVADIDKAVADIEKALKIDPNSPGNNFLVNKIKEEKEVVYRLRRER